MYPHRNNRMRINECIKTKKKIIVYVLFKLKLKKPIPIELRPESAEINTVVRLAAYWESFQKINFLLSYIFWSWNWWYEDDTFAICVATKSFCTPDIFVCCDSLLEHYRNYIEGSRFCECLHVGVLAVGQLDGLYFQRTTDASPWKMTSFSSSFSYKNYVTFQGIENRAEEKTHMEILTTANAFLISFLKHMLKRNQLLRS